MSKQEQEYISSMIERTASKLICEEVTTSNYTTERAKEKTKHCAGVAAIHPIIDKYENEILEYIRNYESKKQNEQN